MLYCVLCLLCYVDCVSLCNVNCVRCTILSVPYYIPSMYRKNYLSPALRVVYYVAILCLSHIMHFYGTVLYEFCILPIQEEVV